MLCTAAAIFCGIILGAVACIAGLNSKNRTWAAGRFAAICLSNLLPFKALLSLPENSQFHLVFVLAFCASLIGVFILIYAMHFRSKISEFKEGKTAKNPITLLQFVTMGIQNFEEFIAEEKKSKNEKDEKKSLRNKIEQTKEEIIKSKSLEEFVATIYRLLEVDLPMGHYISRIMEEAVLSFFNKSDAACTYMTYNAEKDCLECNFTTRNAIDKPGDIYLDKPNLFSESVRQRRPILYSNNKDLHFVTTNNGRDKQEYSNYVAFYIDLQQENKPVHCVCFEAVSEIASIRLQAIYELNLFGYIEHGFRAKLGMLGPAKNSEKNNEDEKKKEQKK